MENPQERFRAPLKTPGGASLRAPWTKAQFGARSLRWIATELADVSEVVVGRCGGSLRTWENGCRKRGPGLGENRFQIPSGKLNITIENGHRNSEFSHEKWWFSIVMLVYQRVSLVVRWFFLESKLGKAPAKICHEHPWSSMIPMALWRLSKFFQYGSFLKFQWGHPVIPINLWSI